MIYMSVCRALLNILTAGEKSARCWHCRCDRVQIPVPVPCQTQRRRSEREREREGGTSHYTHGEEGLLSEEQRGEGGGGGGGGGRSAFRELAHSLEELPGVGAWAGGTSGSAADHSFDVDWGSWGVCRR